MTTIKSHTDLEQSKKLAKILPTESADMWWSRCTITDFGDGVLKVSYAVEPCNISQFRNTKEDVPAWSLAALLGVIPEVLLENYYVPNLQKVIGEYTIAYADDELLCIADNPVDVCVAMIEKIYELKML